MPFRASISAASRRRPPSPPPAGNPLWSLDLNSGTGTTGLAAFPQVPNVDYFNCVSIDRIQRLTVDGPISPPSGQSHMMRVQHNATDVWNATHRAELNCGFAGISNMLGGGSLEGKTIWIGFKILARSPWETPDWIVCGQVHGGNNNILGHTYDDIGPKEQIEVEGPAAGQNTRIATIVQPPSLDTWNEIKIGFAPFSTGSGGITNVYYNGVFKGGGMPGPNLFTGFESSPFLKLGIYRSGNVVDLNVYYSNVRMATSLANLG